MCESRSGSFAGEPVWILAGYGAGAVAAGTHRVGEVVRVVAVGASRVAEHASRALMVDSRASTSGVRAAFHRASPPYEGIRRWLPPEFRAEGEP